MLTAGRWADPPHTLLAPAAAPSHRVLKVGLELGMPPLHARRAAPYHHPSHNAANVAEQM